MNTEIERLEKEKDDLHQYLMNTRPNDVKSILVWEEKLRNWMI